MPALIPIFFLPLRSGLAASLTTQDAAEAAVAEATPESGLRTATSTNWWHCVLTVELCRAWQLRGLECLDQVLCVLSPSQAALAVQCVSDLLAHLGSLPLPRLGRELGPDLAALAGADRSAATQGALPARNVDESSGDVHSYFQFLATIKDVANLAAQAGHHLLFFAPQP